MACGTWQQLESEPVRTADNDFVRMLEGYSLTTAEIIYRMPDHPALIQSYIWQEYDLHPRFPKLKSFLEFWSRNLEGKLYKVLVAHTQPDQAARVQLVRRRAQASTEQEHATDLARARRAPPAGSLATARAP